MKLKQSHFIFPNCKLPSVFCFLLTAYCSLLTAFPQSLTDKDITYFKKYEDSLVYYQKKVFYGKTDSAKFKDNAKFVHLWDEVLSNQLSFYYGFDSLKEVSRLVSSDKKVRIVNWNIPRVDGSQYYFGFVQWLNPKTNHYEVDQLIDKSASIKTPESYISDNTKWFGMLYYSIISCGDYYTLLGWDGNDKVVTRKFVDVLSFKKDGTPMFGKDVFKFPKRNPKRVMFEYSAKVVMSLRYNESFGAIVYDHLAAKDEYTDGQAQFYGPDFSYDALILKHGKWNYTPDVDVKNPKNKNDNIKRKEKKDKPIYAPHN